MLSSDALSSDALDRSIMKHHAPLFALLALCAFAAPAAAADTVPAGTTTCEVADRSSTVVLLACPAGLAPEALRQAGTAACLMRTQCNAWIWTDRTKMPKTAPAVQADLPESARAHAIAIWANDSQSLLTLRRKPR